MKEKITLERKKDKNIEYMRAIACVGVVGIHVCKSAHDIYTNMPDWAMLLCTFVVNNLRWCVPVFLMITGALLLDPRKNIDLRKIVSYVWRVLVVLFVFGTGFALMEIVFEQKTLRLNMIPQAIVNMLAGKSWDHLWYLYTLVMIYCFLPALRTIALHMQSEMLVFTCAMIAIFSCLFPMLEALGLPVGLPKNPISIYMLYPIVGYMLKNKILKLSKRVSKIGIVASTMFLGGMAYLSEMGKHAVDSAFISHASAAVMIQSICVFCCMLEIGEAKNERVNKGILSLANASFGIYILHMVYINVFYKVLQFNPEKYTVAIMLPVFALTLILTYTTVVLMRKIPLVKKFF